MRSIGKLLLASMTCLLFAQGCIREKMPPVVALPVELAPLLDALTNLSGALELVDNDCGTSYETVLKELSIVRREFDVVVRQNPNLIPRREDFDQRFKNLQTEATYIKQACRHEIFVTPLFISTDHMGGALGEWRARINFIIENLSAPVSVQHEVIRVNLTDVDITPATPIGTNFRDCTEGFCPEMIVVPGGTFMMGATQEQLNLFKISKDRRHWELPRHQVTIPRPFAVGKYEVTLAAFQAFVDETGYEVIGGCRTYLPDADPTGQTFRANISYKDIGFPTPANSPVSCITKENAKAYTHWLSKKTGKNYRLPTEAEWEFFARAGTETAYFWGDEIALGTNFANVYDQSSITANDFRANGNSFEPYPGSDGFAYKAPIGSFPPNAFGLHDVIGNVREWVEDVWIDDPIGNYVGAPTDGSARKDGLTLFGLSRGGGWYYQPSTTRSSYRDAYLSSEMRGTTWGFRVVRDL
ncbi:formylglycine-generating enzyme family protein [Sphingobacterium corticibacter]|uniref:Sulfatase-modifying factor enzyme-like domain-containing protein n=1 Tax=Sphingobacterium corticibacter TaxID=2171749 RepID=A0A2T8HFA0_9SPHI|nr:formylglycine-generating enzyme family protein [Sphingobacterium corticibacter]PVH24083.1 hypothetical protein DC487_15190 [Sphingobacterium corticibacter]